LKTIDELIATGNQLGRHRRRRFTPQLLNRLRMRQIALLLAVEECATLRGAAKPIAEPIAEHGLVAVIDYAFRHKLTSYGGIVRRDRDRPAPMAGFLAQVAPEAFGNRAMRAIVASRRDHLLRCAG